MLSIIVAICKDNKGIGYKGTIPWPRLKSDMRWFRKKTLNKTVVMGRKTFESIGKALPKRHNIVLSTSLINDSVDVARSFEELDNLINNLLSNDKDVVIIGGQDLYDYYINKCQVIYVTIIDSCFECDRFFPDFSNFKGKKLKDHCDNNIDYSIWIFVNN